MMNSTRVLTQSMNICGAIWECLTCSQSSSLVISGHKYSIIKLLGDGGYAFVYLVRRTDTQELFALKKIRCMFGGESVANAMREVDACRVLKNTDHIVPCIDSSVVQEEDGSKTVYIVMPYYSKGTLQDKINENVVSQAHFSERKLLDYAIGIAEALMAMHGFHQANISNTETPDHEASEDRPDSNQEQERLLDSHEMTDMVSYAHRDLKPANVMFNDSQQIVLIDLGSCSPAKIDVSTRQKAVQLQDLASEHCTLPYRAPELFDVRTGSQIDEKVDVWGLGCTIYCMMYGQNPFEREESTGGNINLCIVRGKFTFPDSPTYSSKLKNIVKQCLTVNSVDRPSVEAINEQMNDLLGDLN